MNVEIKNLKANLKSLFKFAFLTNNLYRDYKQMLIDGWTYLQIAQSVQNYNCVPSNNKVSIFFKTPLIHNKAFGQILWKEL